MTAPTFLDPDWHTPHVPLWRAMLAPLVGQPVRALEVGSYEGRSAHWLLSNVLTHPDASITCIDTFENRERERRFFANASGAHALAGPSSEWLPRLFVAHGPGSYDFIYIDGSHDAHDVLLDATLALELVRVGGLLAFDDYEWGGGDGPKRAVDALFACNTDRLEVLHVGAQAWFRRAR